jgi:hypothetical protein
MYNYINGIVNYDNIKNYINEIYNINNNIITKKDIYIGNNFYNDLYEKIKPIKNKIFDIIKPLNQKTSIFEINNYNDLIFGKYDLNNLINNLIYKDKYTFNKNKDDNLKIQIFLDKLDISSNDINEENRKKLIDLLLIFVNNFIDD